MTKLQILDLKGTKAGDIDTEIFEGQVRDDIVQRIVEVERYYAKQPYAPDPEAGNQTSASGNVRHSRHEWKSDRGKGVSRMPKKRMSDKGDRFSWVVAVVPGARKGRRAHPPRTIRAHIRYNRKEFILGLLSCLAASSSSDMLSKKYATLSDKKISLKLPLIFSSKILTSKTKEFYSSLKSILGEDVFSIALQEKSMRPGIGKLRGRKYKKTAGLLLITGNNENMRISGIEVIKANELQLKDIGVGGRLVAFTEQAIKTLESRIYGRKETTENKEVKKKEAKK